MDSVRTRFKMFTGAAADSMIDQWIDRNPQIRVMGIPALATGSEGPTILVRCEESYERTTSDLIDDLWIMIHNITGGFDDGGGELQTVGDVTIACYDYDFVISSDPLVAKLVNASNSLAGHINFSFRDKAGLDAYLAEENNPPEPDEFTSLFPYDDDQRAEQCFTQTIEGSSPVDMLFQPHGYNDTGFPASLDDHPFNN